MYDSRFIENAKALVRNPLGVIGLFICFVYALASSAFLWGGRQLTSGQDWALVLFVCLFPVAILVTFYSLVAKHHTKLYAPRDFPTPDGFVQALGWKEIQENKQREVAEASVPTPQTNSGADPVKFIEAAPLDAKKYREIEDLVFRELEAQIGAKFHRELALVVDGKRQVVLDGALPNHNPFVGVEVKLARNGEVKRETLLAVIDQAKRTREAVRAVKPHSAMGFIFVPVITNGPLGSQEKIWALASEVGHEQGFFLDVRPMELETLRRRFSAG